MLRLIALFCSLALLLAPVAQAQSGCAMTASAGMHAAHGADHQMPSSGHPTQACKAHCAAMAILISPATTLTPFVTVRPAPLHGARLVARAGPGPFLRPPKDLV